MVDFSIAVGSATPYTQTFMPATDSFA